MKLKYKSSIALILVGILGFTSCSFTTAEHVEITEPTHIEVVDITIFQNKSEINSQLKKATTRYMELNPHVNIQIQELINSTSYADELDTFFSSDITIFTMSGVKNVETWQPKLEDLSDQPWVEHALTGTLDEVSINDSIYGLPYSIEGYGLIYNKAIFEACGIDPSSVTNFETLKETFTIIESKIVSGELEDQFPMLENVTIFPTASFTLGLHTSNSFLNHEFTNSVDAAHSKSIDFTFSDSFKNFVDLMTDFSKYSNNKAKLSSVSYNNQLTSFVTEQVAVIQQGDWIYNEIYKLNPDIASNIGMLPLPVQGGVEDSISVGVPMYWSINKEAPDEDKEVAKDFLNWLYQSEEGKDIIVNNFTFIPPFTNYEGFEYFDPLIVDILSYIEKGKTTPFVTSGYPLYWGQFVLAPNIRGYLAGELTWDEAIEKSIASWEESRK